MTRTIELSQDVESITNFWLTMKRYSECEPGQVFGKITPKSSTYHYFEVDESDVNIGKAFIQANQDIDSYIERKSKEASDRKEDAKIQSKKEIAPRKPRAYNRKPKAVAISTQKKPEPVVIAEPIPEVPITKNAQIRIHLESGLTVKEISVLMDLSYIRVYNVKKNLN